MKTIETKLYADGEVIAEMTTCKIIELMNRIAEYDFPPKSIEYEGEIYIFRSDLHDYENKYADFEKGIYKYKYLFGNPFGKDYQEFFNDEVEII